MQWQLNFLLLISRSQGPTIPTLPACTPQELGRVGSWQQRSEAPQNQAERPPPPPTPASSAALLCRHSRRDPRGPPTHSHPGLWGSCWTTGADQWGPICSAPRPRSSWRDTIGFKAKGFQETRPGLEAISHSVTAHLCLWGRSGAPAWDILPSRSLEPPLQPALLSSSGCTLLLLPLLSLLLLTECPGLHA